jgi:hypothetical protein
MLNDIAPSMKTFVAARSCLLLSFNIAVAESPPMQVPRAPEISAAKVVELADAHVAKTFPKDRSLYCQSVRLIDGSMRPVRAYRHWDLAYRRAGVARTVDQQSGKETFGDFHVYVTMSGEVSQEPRVELREVQKKGDKVEVSVHDDTLFVEAECPSGIGGARLELASGMWPKKVVVHLKYAADNPFTNLEGPGAALESTGSKADEPRLKLNTRRLKPDGFEADIPTTEVKVLYLHWVDAYRH